MINSQFMSQKSRHVARNAGVQWLQLWRHSVEINSHSSP